MTKTKDSLTLNNGVKIPKLGLGCFMQNNLNQTYYAAKWALDSGYRLIDTASFYQNERSIGLAIQNSGINREDIFITTKLWNEDIRQRRTREAFFESLSALKVDYIDLYLIHWPVDGLKEAWLEMEKLYNQGLIKAIGVSNFHPQHLKYLEEFASVTPAINQIESHPLMNNQKLIDYCHAKNIAVGAWSPLGSNACKYIFNLPEIIKIAAKHTKTTAQIVLRWHLQRNVIPIPKSTNRDRIHSNLGVLDFKLTSEEMQLINQLNQNIRVGPDPNDFDF